MSRGQPACICEQQSLAINLGVLDAGRSLGLSAGGVVLGLQGQTGSSWMGIRVPFTSSGITDASPGATRQMTLEGWTSLLVFHHVSMESDLFV